MIKHFILGYFALLQIGSLIETILRHNLPWSWFAVRPSMDNSEMRLFVWMTEALGAAKRFVPPCHFTLHTALTTDRPARGQGRGGAASYRPRQKIIFIYTSQSRAPTQSGRRWEVLVSDEMCGLEVFASPRRKTDTIRTLGDRRRRAAATQPAAAAAACSEYRAE